MKKLLLILSICLFQFYSSKACSCSGESAFCDVSSASPTHHIFIGKILQHDSLSSKFQILDNLRGIELLDTITIWNFNDTLPGIPCFQSISNAIGSVGDSVLIVLPKIVQALPYNTHAAIGDYFAPSTFCAKPYLPISNGIITGNLTKPYLATSPPMPYVIDSISITDFKANYNSNGVDCDLFVGLPDIKAKATLLISPNPFQNFINIESSFEFKSIEVINILGEIVYSSLDTQTNRIDLSELNTGVYFLSLELKGGEKISKKLIKD